MEVKLKKIINVAKRLGLINKNLELYGDFKAKVKNVEITEHGKLILVTAITPTKSGEGKTTISIGLADAFSRLKKKACLALREPSLGPVFGMKGGATGGGKATIEPSDDINLHFTGDMHAITSANNLLCAMIDNHIYFGNELDIQKVAFNRCIDMNDRALREITINQEKLNNNKERKECFVITPASEIMAILCLAENMEDLKARLGNIIIGFNTRNRPIFAKDLKAENAMAKLLEKAFIPNLVQTACGTPAFVHGGPFANIAHGCNSIVATKTALTLSNFVITEAGFGADLGAEKFFDLKCRRMGVEPRCVVLVVTAKAVFEHGQFIGFENLKKHVENITKVFKQNCVVAINHFTDDKEEDILKIKEMCKNIHVDCAVCYPFEKGGEGCVELAKKVFEKCTRKVSQLEFAYELEDSIENKITNVAKKVYGATGVEFSDIAKNKIKMFEPYAKNFEVIIAKTQYSLSDDEKLIGCEPFVLHVGDIELRAGAGFVVAICGKINLMPGLPKFPNAIKF